MNDFLNSKDVKRSVIALLILLSVFLLVKSINELKANKSIGKDDFVGSTIVVSGMGEVSARPDIAIFSFTVIGEEETVKGAQDSVSKRVSKILDSLEGLGVEEKDINTLNYNIYPRYEFFSRQQICPAGFVCPPASGERVLVGYEVSQSVSIKLRDLERVGEVLDSLGGLEVSNVNGPNFDFEDREELVREARKMAIDDAKEKAKDLSKDLGVSLVRIVNFSEGGNFRFAKFDQSVSESVGMGGDFIPEIPIGESEISSNVEIVYEIK